MEESSAPKPFLEFKTKAEINNEIINILLAQKLNNLLIKINQVN